MKQPHLAWLCILVAAFACISTKIALAGPMLFQCPAPTRAVGTVGLRVPVPVPTSGELKLQFQRPASESTQTTINFAEFRNVHTLLDRIAKAINDEAAQRGPKMASVRERGLDNSQFGSAGNISVIAINEVFRFLYINDPDEVQISFQAPSEYPINCETIAPLRGDIPNLSEIAFQSKPQLLFVAFPNQISSGRSAVGAVAFADREDDLNIFTVSYRSEDGSINDIAPLPLVPIPIPSPFGPGLKAVKFELVIHCRQGPVSFQAKAFAGDKGNNNSEPLSFSFVCDR
jgi:hypothetical protein